MYGMEDYLMIMHKVEKARLDCQATKAHQEEGFYPPPYGEQAMQKKEERDG